jgi:hypothetical protein
MENNYNKLRALNVNEHTEKKGNLTYLSWAWAVDTLLQHDSNATWEFPEPRTLPDNSVMVFCNVTAFGKTLPMQLPVMDNLNKAIKNPDARKISDSTMRCLAKCIACFGIGLYIYAGEDLPNLDEPEKQEPRKTAGAKKASGEGILAAMNACASSEALNDVWFDYKGIIEEFKNSPNPAEKLFHEQIMQRGKELREDFKNKQELDDRIPY